MGEWRLGRMRVNMGISDPRHVCGMYGWMDVNFLLRSKAFVLSRSRQWENLEAKLKTMEHLHTMDAKEFRSDVKFYLQGQIMMA